MSPWAKRMLIGAMVLWTVLTAAAGYYATRTSSGGAASATTAGATPGTPAAGSSVSASAIASSSPTSRTMGAGASRTSDSAVPTYTSTAGVPPTPKATPAPRREAPPSHAAAAGFGERAESLNPDGTGPGAGLPTPPAKAVIVLDPGHGRGDPGAVHHLPDGTVDITEADSNLRNAELIRDNLVAMGYEVYLTREGDGKGPGGPLPLQWITSDLYARVGLANAVDADLYLAIHGNGASVTSISGPETWYCGKHEQGAANERLARMVQQAMMDALHEYGYAPPDRGIKEDAETHHSGGFCEFVVTRETPVPAALLEFLFLSNDDDAKVLVDDRAHVLMARHVADAIDAFMRDRGS
jgi:N-acetylmuramoyl-L-alanine amidase